jgi:enamine deaminase RidA (YjgF/YER057c/UK114 family)
MESRDWQLPVDYPQRLGRRAGRFCFVGAAGDLDDRGRITNSGDLLGQVEGAIENTAATLQANGCDLGDVIRLKAFFRPGSAQDRGWALLRALRSHFPQAPAPVISMQPVVMTPWSGQELQLQAIAVRGWRDQDPIRVVAEPLSESQAHGSADYTRGLLAGGFFAVSDIPGFGEGFDGDSVAETGFVMDRLETIMRELDVSFGDVIKKEGYWDLSLAPWELLAKVRASRFPEGVAVATVVPWHEPWPSNVTTKVELLGYRSQLGDRSKPVARADSWPDWVWDWPTPVPYRQGLLADECVWIGGQVPAGAGRIARIQSPGDLNRQVDYTMGIIGDILRGFDTRLDDLVLLVGYYESDGSDESSRRFLDRLAMNIPGALPPVTLVPQPAMHAGLKTEIWGVARANNK